MRHTFRLKTDFVTFRAPGWRLCSFLYARNLGDPLNCWKTQKTASKLVSYFQEGDTNTEIWSASRKRVVFSKRILIKVSLTCRKTFCLPWHLRIDFAAHSFRRVESASESRRYFHVIHKNLFRSVYDRFYRLAGYWTIGLSLHGTGDTIAETRWRQTSEIILKSLLMQVNCNTFASSVAAMQT